MPCHLLCQQHPWPGGHVISMVYSVKYTLYFVPFCKTFVKLFISFSQYSYAIFTPFPHLCSLFTHLFHTFFTISHTFPTFLPHFKHFFHTFLGKKQSYILLYISLYKKSAVFLNKDCLTGWSKVNFWWVDTKSKLTTDSQ